MIALVLGELHLVQRVRDRFDQPSCTAVWKLRVRIEGDDITDRRRRRSSVHKMPDIFPIEKPVQFLQLPAFSLPSDPSGLGFTPYAWSAEEDEGIVAMMCVELLYTLDRQSKQVIVFGHLGFFRIGKVREERKIKVGQGIGQVTYFQFLDLAANRVRCQEHHGHDHESAAIFRYALLERHFRQRPRRHKPGQPHLQRIKSKFARRNKRNYSQEQQHQGRTYADGVSRSQEGTQNTGSEYDHAAKVDQGRTPVEESQPPFAPCNAPPYAAFKFGQSFIQEVKGNAVFAGTPRALLRQLDRQARDIPLGTRRLACRFFNDAPAPVPRAEIAAGVNPGWIFPQDRLEPAHRLDDLWIFQLRELPQTSNRCRDEHQVIRFFGVLTQNDVGQVSSGFHLDPSLNRSQRGLFLMQLFAQTCDEMRRQFVAAAIQFSDYLLKFFGTTLCSVQKAVRPEISHFLLVLAQAGQFRQPR